MHPCTENRILFYFGTLEIVWGWDTLLVANHGSSIPELSESWKIHNSR